jgi:Tfp pilus assembly protein PilN
MKTVNLLPAWYLNQRRQKRRTQMHVVAMIALAGALAAANVVCVRQVEDLQGQHGALEARLGALPDEENLVKTRQAELGRLENIQLAYQELGSPVPMSAVIQQIQNDMSPGMALSQVTIEVQPEAVKGSGFVGDASAPPKFHDVARLTVVGVSPDDEKMVRLIQKLSANPLFTDVSLNYARNEAIREYAVRRFEIHMQMDVEQLGTEDAAPGSATMPAAKAVAIGGGQP